MQPSAPARRAAPAAFGGQGGEGEGGGAGWGVGGGGGGGVGEVGPLKAGNIELTP